MVARFGLTAPPVGDHPPATASAVEHSTREFPEPTTGRGIAPIAAHDSSRRVHQFGGHAGVGHRDGDPLVLRRRDCAPPLAVVTWRRPPRTRLAPTPP